MYLPRYLAEKLKRLFRSFPAVAVLGARQVGKTTLLRETFRGKADLVTFDPVLDIGGARSDPDLFLDSRSCPLILDEIQYVPSLIPALKRRIDKDRRPGKYLITGSQRWEVMKALAESLAGRVVFLDLEGFSLGEISKKGKMPSWLESFFNGVQFRLQESNHRPRTRSVFEQVWRGWLPEAQFIDLELLPDFFLAYQRTYLDRDLRTMLDVGDWQTFGRFIALVAHLTAQEMNFAHLGRELGLSPQTVRRWLATIQATFQWFEVPAYSGNATKRVAGKSKGYFADTGLACFFQGISSPTALSGHPSFGHLFETAVAAELRKLCLALPFPPKVFHWRSFGGAEVDFLLELDGKLFPIEVKASSHPGRSDARGIMAFRQAHPKKKIGAGLIIAPVDTPYMITEEVQVIPWDLDGIQK